ncbi:MAG: ABC transporter permease subunit [Ezakiella sp.]|nr:ABC transporter permease subunit [Ezakiella sp.]
MRKFKDNFFRILIFINCAVFIIILYFLFANLIRESGTISLDFIFGSPEGLPPGREGGIYPAIMGSLLSFFISSFISSFLAILSAIYIVFYLKNSKIKSSIRLIIQMISGIPSIVLGLFGYTMFVYRLAIGRSLLSASLTLAIMIFPFIEIRVEKLFLNFSKDIFEMALSLGLDRYFVIKKIILKALQNKIIQTITLGGSLAFGATAPIMLTGAVIYTGVPKSLLKPYMSLPYHLYILINEGISSGMGYKTAVVLMILLFIINISAMLIGGRSDD